MKAEKYGKISKNHLLNRIYKFLEGVEGYDQLYPVIENYILIFDGNNDDMFIKRTHKTIVSTTIYVCASTMRNY